MPQIGENCVIEPLESRLLLAAFLLDDVNPKTPQGMNSRVGILGNYVYFGGDDGNFGGKGVWRSDGTEAGTELFAPGAPSFFYTTAGNRLYASNGSIWTTDGRPDGSSTLTLSDGSPLLDANGVRGVGNRIFFFRPMASSAGALWVSDGTAAGTSMVKQLYPGSLNSNVTEMIAVNGLFYFIERSNTAMELWRSDGTAAGTFALTTVSSSLSDHLLTRVGNTLFFYGTNGLWKSDGTVAGTVLVKSLSYLHNFVDLNGRLAFFSDLDLWTSNGTTAGTQLVRQMYPTNIFGTWATEFAVLDGVGYFQQPVIPLTGPRRLELWRTNGTNGGTTVVTVMQVAHSTYQGSSTATGGLIYYWTEDGTNDQLWRIDASGPSLVSSFSNLPWSVPSKPMLSIGNQTYFQGGDGIHGDELWVTDGTAAGTHMVRDVNAYSAASNPAGFINLGERVIFSASRGLGSILYRTSGTAGTTEPVRYNDNSVPGAAILTRGDGFVAWLSGGLFKTDGTDEGSVVVDPTVIPFNNSRELTYSNGKYFVWGNTSANGSEVWVNDNDGAQHGFHMLEIRPGSSSSMAATPSGFVSYNGNTYFTANGPAGFGLWKSDGTQAGTTQLAAFTTLTLDSKQAISYGGYLYFVASDGTAKKQLWRTDGTPEGTTKLADIFTGLVDSSPPGFVVFNGKLFFRGGNEGTLWSTDGSLANTGPVPGAPNNVGNIGTAYGVMYFNSSGSIWRYDGASAPSTFKSGSMDTPPLEFKGNIWFWGYDGLIHGTELWHSDGTPQGTEILDLTPGGSSTGDSSPELVALGKRLIFDGIDALHNREPWVYVDDLPPRVLSADLDSQASEYRLVVRFNETVLPSGVDLRLENLDTGQIIPAGAIATTMAADGMNALITFPAYPNGILADGNYRLTIPSGWVIDDTTNELIQSYFADFFWLKGDLNRDRTVSIADFITLASNFNKTSATYADGDINYDGQVTIADFIALAASFNKTLPAPAAPQAPAALEISSFVSTASTDVLEGDGADSVLEPKAPLAFPRQVKHHRKPRHHSVGSIDEVREKAKEMAK